jgi:hypothetical protein
LNPLKVLNKGSRKLWHAIYDGKDLMVKMGQIGLEIRKTLLDEVPKKMVKQVTSPKSTISYHSNQTIVAESRVVSSPRAWELDESHSIGLVVGGTSPRA